MAMKLQLIVSAIIVVVCLIYPNKGLLQDVSCDKRLSNSIKCTFTNLNDDEIRFKVPTKNFESVTFKNCNLTKFPTTLFSTFPKITKVDLSTSHVRQLNGNKTLNGAKNLKILDLSRNDLKEIEDFVFSEGKELKELHLSRNKIISVGLNAFAGLNKLELLDLSFNAIEILEKKVFSGLKKLKFIYVNNNALKKLTFNFIYFMDLTELDISYNKDLQFSGLFPKVPPHIKPKLTLNISYCCENTKSFKIWQNSIKKYIGKYNKFSEMIIKSDVHIETMDFSGNLLSNLKNITNTRTLRNLDLSENPLSPLHFSTFSLLDDLRTLNLRSTGISLDQNYFKAQKKLTFLDISANGLTSLNLKNLKSLSNLQTLYLHENKLIELENVEDIKTILPSLTTISLYKNDFGCSYNILMHELFENLKIKVYDGTDMIKKEDIDKMRVNCSEMRQLRPKNLEQAVFFKQITNYLNMNFQDQLTKSTQNLMNDLEIEKSKTNEVISNAINDFMKQQNEKETDLKAQISCDCKKLVKDVNDHTDQVSVLKNITSTITAKQSKLEKDIDDRFLKFDKNTCNLENKLQTETSKVNQNIENLNKMTEDLKLEVNSVKILYGKSKKLMDILTKLLNILKDLY